MSETALKDVEAIDATLGVLELRLRLERGALNRTDLLVLIRVLRTLMVRLEQGQALLQESRDAAGDAIRDLRGRLEPIEARLLLLDELPDSAPFGALIRLTAGTVAERTPLYLGNGPNHPLTKLTPTAL